MPAEDLGTDIGEVVILKSTPRAVLVVLKDLGGARRWIPSAHVKPNLGADPALMFVSTWLARLVIAENRKSN